VAARIGFLLAALLFFAFGGTPGLIALFVEVLFVWAKSWMSLPPRGHNAGVWLINPLKPILVVSPRLEYILDHDELEAVVAHETWHMTLVDRFWRLVANTLDSAAPIAAAFAMRLGLPFRAAATLIVLAWLAGALMLAWMLRRSEFRADRHAAELGFANALARALPKLDRAAAEVMGPGPGEVIRSEEEYLEALGGRAAVPSLSSSSDAIFLITPLSAEGKLLVSFIDGARTVDEIAQMMRERSRHLEPLWVYRLLYQLTESNAVTMRRP
jgi:Zn-dependent protease with chaperone function